ncbi:NlpC/P60 family protein [Streptomyces sp. NPDC046197]|uniref:C40 family peptidase n=1 Tax=Streptomyces sp. NPDC046197 TaxID=3154337 RepID=UPI0033E4F6B5
MAPERPSRPGGTSLPGTRTPAVATAADDRGPSRAEVQQRISSLYDQAETSTGNYNATRAMSRAGRPRANSSPGRASRDADPLLDSIAKQWFDGARAQFGPSVPAALPADRMPKPANSRPAASARGAIDGPAGLGREANLPALLELTAGPDAAVTTGARPELTGGPGAALTAGPVAELPARALPELPAVTPMEPTVIATPAETTAGAPAELPARTMSVPLPTPPETQLETVRALPATVARPRQPAWWSSKERLQRKVAQARELLARHAAQHSAPPVQAAPVPAAAAPATAPWPTSEESWPSPYPGPEQVLQQSAEFVPALPVDVGGTALGADIAPAPEQAVTTPSFAAPAAPPVAEAVPVGEPMGSAYERKAAKALDFARAQIGRPCVWGATGPDSYDCSSLTQAAWRTAGVALPRTAYEQSASGTAISLAELRAGDLIFFYGDAGHVGLYSGNGMMVHAPSPGASIREESIFFAGPQAIQGAVRPA